MKCNLLEYFEETVGKKKEAVAVRHNDQSIDFGELHIRARQLGIHLIALTDSVINTPIAVFLPKEINAVIADLGILYSSNPFMNLDVKTPQERLMNILELIRPAAIITSKKYAKTMEHAAMPLIFIDEIDWESIEIKDDLLLERRNMLIDTDPFCLINTSGSTGTPKGVILNQRSFFDFIAVSNERF